VTGGISSTATNTGSLLTIAFVGAGTRSFSNPLSLSNRPSSTTSSFGAAFLSASLGGWWLVEVSLSQFLPFYLTQFMRHVVRDNVEINHKIICDGKIYFAPHFP
jgi:hypothetical protein